MRFTGSYIATVVSCDIGFPVFIFYCLLLAVYFYELDFGCLTITRYLRDLDHKIPSVTTAQKMFPADLVTFTEEILKWKTSFFCAVNSVKHLWRTGAKSKCSNKSFRDISSYFFWYQDILLITFDHPLR